jgi:hypothetical protein
MPRRAEGARAEVQEEEPQRRQLQAHQQEPRPARDAAVAAVEDAAVAQVEWSCLT